MSYFLSYLAVRLFTFPLAYLPYRVIHLLGRGMGSLAYHLYPKFRKRALANIASAPALSLPSDQIPPLAKASLQSLMITLLEYPRLAKEKEISNIAVCENPETADEIMSKGKGVIFFCGHQANWELLFLEGTSRMPGLAIGRPIKNPYLYRWVLRIRQKFGGTIVPPKEAIKEGLKALRKGKFLGIVGDQGMPDSGYSYPFLGRQGWTSPVPALLAYKTNTPLIVATTVRKGGKYHIRYSKPLIPDQSQPKETEVPRLMDMALSLFEEGVKAHPEQWMWIHNRWKQQTPGALSRPFRHDTLALFLPEDPKLIENLPLFRKLYPTEEITLFVPKPLQNEVPIEAEVIPYTHAKELLREDYRFKLLFNFLGNPEIDRHYKKRATQKIHHPRKIDDDLEALIRGNHG